MNCAFCRNGIPEDSPSDDFCSQLCQRQWTEGNADWPSWACDWNGKNRKGETPKSPYVPYVPYMPYGNGA